MGYCSLVYYQPVLVSNVQKQLKSSLWNPRYFSKQFGNIENDLVDCRKGTVIQGAPMKDFWDGFEDLTSKSNSPIIEDIPANRRLLFDV